MNTPKQQLTTMIDFIVLGRRLAVDDAVSVLQAEEIDHAILAVKHALTAFIDKL